MKKIIILNLVFLLLCLILPLKIDASKSSPSRYSNGQIKYSYSSSDRYNSSEFKYGISAMTGGSSTITFYGWAYVTGVDSYEGYANTYTMQVTLLNDKGDVVDTLPYEVKATNQSLDLTCASYMKNGSVFPNNNTCYANSRSSTSTIVNHIRNGNKKISKSNYWNQIYRNVGFYVTLDLNRIKEELKKKVGAGCPSEGELKDTTCSIKNNCTWKDDKCEFTRSGTAKIGFRLKLKTQGNATKNITEFYRDIGVYDTKSVGVGTSGINQEIIEPSTKTALSKNGFTINSNTLSKKITTVAEYAIVRDSRLAYGNDITVGGKTLYLPAKSYSASSYRTLNFLNRKVYPNTKFPSSNSNSRVFMQGIQVGGVVTTGRRASGEKANSKILKTGSNSQTGWISESWTIPSAGKTILTVNLSETCSCLPSDLDIEQDKDMPNTCADDTQKGKLDDKLVLNKGLSTEKEYEVKDALEVLLNGNNNPASPSRYNYNKIREVRNITNYSKTDTAVYCLKNRDFNLFGKSDILGAFTLGTTDKYLYGGRYFRIEKGSMSANIEMTCASTSKTALEKVLKESNLVYDLEYEPDESLDTKMTNNKNPKNVDLEPSYDNSINGYIANLSLKYEMENTQNYYFDYQTNKVQIGKNLGENMKDGYYIDDHNIYPILSSTPVGKKQDIITFITGDKNKKGNDELSDFTYTCDYVVKNNTTTPDPEPGGDPGDYPEEYMNYYYRTISLNDVFPDHRGSKRPYNWRYVINEQTIEKNANKTYASTPEYAVILTSNNMRNIRKYNLGKEKEGGYLDYSLDCIIVSGKRECKSDFLNNIISGDYAEDFQRNRS